MRLSYRTFCPVGTSENSPAIHRWELSGVKFGSPVGTIEASHTNNSVVPTGLPEYVDVSYPAMNRWATTSRPSGTKATALEEASYSTGGPR
jgi:hypothetical protein